LIISFKEKENSLILMKLKKLIKTNLSKTPYPDAEGDEEYDPMKDPENPMFRQKCDPANPWPVGKLELEILINREMIIDPKCEMECKIFIPTSRCI
jgi:hypothetical protein